MKLADLALYNSLLDDVGATSTTQHNAAIDARINSVSAKVERTLNRTILSGSYTEKFPADKGLGTVRVRLAAYPVVEVSSVKVYQNTYTEGTDFNVDYDLGEICFFVPINREFTDWQQAIVIEYVGGMADSSSDFKTKFPDISLEVCVQVIFEMARQKTIANKSTATGAGIVTSHNPYGLQPGLMETLLPYVRPIGAY